MENGRRQIITENKESRGVVWRPIPADGWVYKRQMKTLCDNEMWCYEHMPHPYVPKAERVDLETIRTEDLGTDMRVLDPDYFMDREETILRLLQNVKIRHGDLTEYSVLVRDNHIPCLIDFAESRIGDDPRPDKRPEGDAHWLTKTLRKRAVHNQRAPEIWDAIRQAVSFYDKMVLDVGCGHGDMLLYAHNAKARRAVGLEPNLATVQLAERRYEGLSGITTFNMYLHEYVETAWGTGKERYDIVLCLSVLPYLGSMKGALGHLKVLGKTVVIECQYAGDGPGTISGDKEMRALLRTRWQHVEPIGHTVVKERDKQRVIWLCS